MSSANKCTIMMTFLVIIKLVPIKTDPDTARAIPMYLSSTMKRELHKENGLEATIV